MIEVNYIPIIMSGKNIQKKLFNISNILKQDFVLGIYSLEKSEFLSTKKDVFDTFENNIKYANDYLPNKYNEIKDEEDVKKYIEEIEELEFKFNEKIDDKDLFLEITSSSEETINLKFNSLFIDSLTYLEDFIESKSVLEEQMYNYNIPDINQITYVLMPIRVIDSENNKYIQITLDLYPNGFGMIKFFEHKNSLKENDEKSQNLQHVNLFNENVEDNNYTFINATEN